VWSWRSFGQIKSKGAVHIMFFKTAVNCELAVPVSNLLAMCELAVFAAVCSTLFLTTDFDVMTRASFLDRVITMQLDSKYRRNLDF
jgi:hypothetical protein